MSKLRIVLCVFYIFIKAIHRKFKIFIKITGKKQELAKTIENVYTLLIYTFETLALIHSLSNSPSLSLALSVTVFLALFIERILLFDLIFDCI